MEDKNKLVEENAALRRRLAAAHSALRLGMSHLKGFYPVPYKEAEVLATMQAAIDGTRDRHVATLYDEADANDFVAGHVLSKLVLLKEWKEKP